MKTFPHGSLPPAAIAHLQTVLAQPDLDGTPYTVGEQLGAGGMGAIYRAHDHRLGRDVAIKVLHFPSLDDQAAQRLLGEARILAQLDHPGIVPVYDVGTLPDGRVYYAMKLVGGHPLGSYARDAPLDRRLRLFERVCETVAFAHAKGVLHRDLKPANIMVGPFGEVLVMDWGVAKALAGGTGPTSAGAPPPGESAGPTPSKPMDDSLLPESPPRFVTAPGTPVGTPGYMAPEQAAGDPAALDARTDVYALGAVLRFLVTGRDPTDPRPLDRGAPARLRTIWERAMAASPGDRYASAAELADDVAHFLAREPVTAYAENPLERLGRLVAKHRIALLLVLGYLAMRLALIWFYGR